MMKGRGGQLKTQPSSRIIIAAVIVLLGLLSFVYGSRFLEIRHLRAQLGHITCQEQVALATQAKLRDQLAHTDDPATIEYLARKELGLVKPGEEKVIFIEVK